MKNIAAARARSLWLVGGALVAGGGCALMGDAQRQVLEADAEAFETVVRSQVTDSAAGTFGFLRVDPRPGSDAEDPALTGPVQAAPALVVPQPVDTLAGLAERIQDQRGSILDALHVEGGGPFNYPDCGGARRVSDSVDANAAGKCPREPVRYVTVGIPYRGAAPVLAKLRSPESPAPDTSAELWTVVVSETNVGPGGQQWRQYAWLFRRDPGSGRLGLAERFLMAWAE